MSKVLTVYFSAGGRTAALAEKISAKAGGELFEVKPEVPYTEADINWKNPISRCNKEKIGKKDIPTVGKPETFESCDTVLVGFPIWYYGAPNIIQSFMKQFDWTGKRIALFATSGGSDIGKTVGKLRPFISGDYRLIAAKVFKDPEDEAAADEYLAGIIK
ncbi:MAG: NAD(P)H-dependent oxidoreductase [Ruminococcus sp.]|nr:NAD(P)H-dependent oxidoreductase [Ruminococcus sp.]